MVTKFITRLIAFSLFFCVFYLIGIILWGKIFQFTINGNLFYQRGAYGHLYTRVREVEKFKKVDILFLGSSHAYRGFDTRIFDQHGFKSFNLGSSSQSPIQTAVLLRKYMDLLSPKLVVYEVYPQTLMNDGVESSLDLIANDVSDVEIMKMVWKSKNPKIINSFIYGLFMDIYDKKSFSEPLNRNKDFYVSGGFVERQLSYSKPEKLASRKFEFRPNQQEAFIEIIQSMKRTNTDFILVFAPIPKGNYCSYVNLNEFESAMKSYGEYIDFNKVMNLDDSLHFYDHHHLNQKGVIEFNNQLIRFLNEKYKL